MQPIVIVLIILVLLPFIALIKTIQVIPQASAAIVERFGRYTRTRNAGFNVVVPFPDTIRNRIDLREQVVTCRSRCPPRTTWSSTSTPSSISR